MSALDPSNGLRCIGFIESSSIAAGIEATDAMMKMADVELLMTAIIPRGKYLIMIAGNVADVESSLRAGIQTTAGSLLDHFIIPNVHDELLPAIRGRVKVERMEAIGIIETKTQWARCPAPGPGSTASRRGSRGSRGSAWARSPRR